MITAMIDTNVCIRAMREGGEALQSWLAATSDELSLSTVVMNELYVGAELSTRRNFHVQLIDELAARLTIIDFDNRAAWHAAQIRAELTRKGQLIGGNDMLIAGHARSLGLKLITADLDDFRRVDGLRCEDWLAVDMQ